MVRQKEHKSKDLLTKMGLVDTTERTFEKREKVEVLCAKCKENVVLVQFYNALHNLNTKGYGAKCKSCLGGENSARAAKRTGESNSFYGKKHSEATKAQIKLTRPEATEKAAKTNRMRYGVAHPAQTDRQKERIKETCRVRYRGDSPMASAEVRKKSIETNRENLGVDNPSQSPDIIAQRRVTCAERYGHDSYSKTEEFKKMASETKRDIRHVLSDGTPLVTLCKQYGVNLSNSIRVLRRYGEGAAISYVKSEHKHMTSLESLFQEMTGLEFYNKKISDEVPYRPDFKVSNALYINVDGLYSHTTRDPDYHLKMRQAYEKQGLRIIQFHEDELVLKGDIVKSMVLCAMGHPSIKKMDARNAALAPLDQVSAKEFFGKNHLMGNMSAAKCIGLVIGGETVAAMSYRQFKDGSVEIARFCNKTNTIVRGGFSRLVAWIERNLAPTRIISYCDLRYATGASYERNGFALQSVSQGWCWTDGNFTFNRLQCRANMDERGLTGDQHAEELGWLKLYDAGQARYAKAIK